TCERERFTPKLNRHLVHRGPEPANTRIEITLLPELRVGPGRFAPDIGEHRAGVQECGSRLLTVSHRDDGNPPEKGQREFNASRLWFRETKCNAVPPGIDDERKLTQDVGA